MDKNNIIGFILIFAIMMLWMQVTKPSAEQIAEDQRIQDSIKMAEQVRTTASPAITNPAAATQPTNVVETDSAAQVRLSGQYGVFGAAAGGSETLQIIENEVMKITFTNKGGRIKEVELKKYDKVLTDAEGVETKIPVKLLEDDKNKFEYLLPVANAATSTVSTGDLYFTPQVNGKTVTFQAKTANGGVFEQKYVLGDDYGIDYNISMQGMNGVLRQDAKALQLNWVNYLDRIEKNVEFEKFYSSVYYKEGTDDPDYCSCRGDDEETTEESIKWISHSNQFFNSALVAEENNSFKGAKLTTVMSDAESEDMKLITSLIDIPMAAGNSNYAMRMYIGPNEYEKLGAFAEDMEYVIPYGWSIFGTINRWFVRPLFQILNGLLGNKGLSILLLTFLVKLAMYPFTYKMLYSQQKMSVLKPKIAALKDKFGEDPQQMQVEQMKMYREYGASPLGGCLPMIIQMPIWYALFRFFPASIDFRQAGFLWANDLSSYDIMTLLPFEIPFYGAHMSLFTILWAVTTVMYTYYNTQHMDMTANPAMKYMQYGMPVMFLFFFNNYASGLTCYMFFSNFLNIIQNIGTKNFIIDNDKMKEELENYKKKPKKKSGFGERMQNALEEQRKLQEKQMKNKKNKK